MTENNINNEEIENNNCCFFIDEMKKRIKIKEESKLIHQEINREKNDILSSLDEQRKSFEEKTRRNNQELQSILKTGNSEEIKAFLKNMNK